MDDRDYGMELLELHVNQVALLLTSAHFPGSTL
jgi:hypothetical protein